MAKKDEAEGTAEEQAPKAEAKSDVDRLAEAGFLAEVMQRTGVQSEAKARALVKRLNEEGDFHDEQGRWTLDVSGFPVCVKGWTEEPKPAAE